MCHTQSHERSMKRQRCVFPLRFWFWPHCVAQMFAFFDQKSLLFCRGGSFSPFLQHSPPPCKLMQKDTMGITDFYFSPSVIDVDTKIPWNGLGVSRKILGEAVLPPEPWGDIRNLLCQSDQTDLLVPTLNWKELLEKSIKLFSVRAVVGWNR